jgi:hypothetical protein
MSESTSPVSPCPTADPEHAGREIAHWFTFNADYRDMLRAHCEGDFVEYLRTGGTVETLQARLRATACGTCGMSADELQGHKFCPDC